MMLTRTLTFLLGLTMTWSAVSATEYFVNVHGSDENDGTATESAFASVQRGVDALEPGDTLTVLPGEYFGSVRREGLGGPDAETTIRVQIPGTVLLRGDVPVSGFERVDGYRFVYATDLDHDGEVHAVSELDSLTIFKRLPNIDLLEFTPGTFHYDREAGKLYISTPDLTPPSEHQYTAAITGDHGLYLREPQRVTIEGLAVTGFSQAKLLHWREGTHGATWGIFLVDGKHCVIRDCRAYMNAHGIGVNSYYIEDSGDNVIEQCIAWANASQYGSGDAGGLTIHGTRAGRRDVIRDSISFRNTGYGVNVYATGGPAAVDPENRYRMINNFAWGNTTADFKIKTGHAYAHTAEQCISLGLWSLNEPSHCLMDRFARDHTADNIVLEAEEDLDLDAEFADPANHDYRLQATSRFRGAGPDGEDRGPHPHEANIYFVAPDGSDEADGLSVQHAWATLAHALAQLEPGDTLYLEPGAYEAAGTVTAGEEGAAPIAIRGRDTATITGALSIRNSHGLRFERLHFADGANVTGSEDVQFENCTFTGGNVALTAEGVTGLRVRHGTFTGFERSALALTNTSGVFLQGNLFDNDQSPAVVADRDGAVRYSDYNTYRSAASAWEVGGSSIALDGLAPAHDRYSTTGTPRFASKADAVKLENRSAFATHGPFAMPAGSYRGFAEQPDEPELRLAGPFVHSVTDTTANIEWWTSAPTGIELTWGESLEDGQTVRRQAHRAGSFSLTELKPNTQYVLRITLDRDLTPLNGERIESHEGDSVTITFSTADQAPQARTYHVAPGGDNAHAGLSGEEAWRTISHAAGQVRPGDTVLIHGGTYHEAVRLRATGTPEAPITFKAAPGEKVVMDGGDRTLEYAFYSADKSHLRFDGFYFRGFSHRSDVMAWSDTALNNNGSINLYHNHDVHITRCFHDGNGGGYSPGLLMAVRSSDVLMRHCLVRRSMGGGISFYGCPNLRIENSVFLRNLIANIGEGVNEPDQKFHLKNNIFTDSIPTKVHGSLFNIGKVKSLVDENNCYFLRVPDEERQMFMFYSPPAYERAASAYGVGTEFDEPAAIQELTRMSLAEYQSQFDTGNSSIVADPEFQAAAGEDATNAEGEPIYVVDHLAGQEDLDFPGVFATNPEIVERGIGLQPEAFEDFWFNQE